MVLWWIGNVILLVVVLPVVIYLLNRVLAALERVRGATDATLSGGPVRGLGREASGLKGVRSCRPPPGSR